MKGGGNRVSRRAVANRMVSFYPDKRKIERLIIMSGGCLLKTICWNCLSIEELEQITYDAYDCPLKNLTANIPPSFFGIFKD